MNFRTRKARMTAAEPSDVIGQGRHLERHKIIDILPLAL